MKLPLDIRVILSHPLIYRFFRKLTGSERINRIIVRDYVRPQAEQTILDVGCGPCDVLNLLGDAHYYGIDIDPYYVSAAKEHFGERGTFRVMDATKLPHGSIPPCDIIIAFGVVHHLADHEVLALLQGVKLQLRPRGRFVSYDPCFTEHQDPLARAIHRLDRGQHVRYSSSLVELVRAVFPTCQHTIRTDLCYVPSTVIVFECALSYFWRSLNTNTIQSHSAAVAS